MNYYVYLSKRLQIWYTQLSLSCCFKHCILFETHLSTLKLLQLKVQVNTSFLFLLHEIMMCKLVRDDVFHRDQMFKNQELNLKIDELYMLQLVILGIENAWLKDSNFLQLVSLKKNCRISVHVSWMWVVYKYRFSYSSYKSYFRIIKTNPYEGFIILQLGDILENPINNPSWMAHNFINIPILIWILECKPIVCDESFSNLKSFRHVSLCWSLTSKTYSCPLVFWKTKSFLSFVDLFV